MIPGRIRNQGIELYEKGLVTITSTRDGVIQARIGKHHLQYALEDDQTRCDCELFAKKRYCQHLAALEYFLKNNHQGKELSISLKDKQESQEEEQRNTSFGSIFLDHLEMNSDDTTKYRLSAYGNQSPYSSNYWWTLKINRLPSDRTYVIRDIKSFLALVKKEGHYQIGKNYFESLSLIQFDEASQELIRFLWRVLPDNEKVDTDYILPNHGRYLALTSGLFEEGLSLLNNLYHFSFEYHKQPYSELAFRQLDGSEGLIRFQVVVHRQSIELIITEGDFHIFFDNAFLFTRGTVYALNLKQQKMLTAIRSLPIEADLAKHLFFNWEDQDKLASSLLDFKELGSVDAPKSFEIKDFSPIFNLSLNHYDEVELHLTFDYGTVQVSSKQELENLPFASHFKHEKRIFNALKANGFSAAFVSYHAPLTPEDLYPFFTKTVTQFRKLGQVILSDDLKALYHVENPRVSVTTQSGLLDISFDFSTIVEDQVDAALEALTKNQPYFIDSAGRLVVFDDEIKKVSKSLQALRAKPLKNGHLQMDAVSTFQLVDVLQDNDRITFSKEFEQLAHDLTHPEQFEMTFPPVKAELHAYQKTGVRWLSMLDHYGFGGILADDMGLGKTLQTITFLASRLKPDMRVLILSPSSLIYNWLDEFKRFAPEIDVVVSYGLKFVRDDIIAQNHQVTITSYSSFRQDFEEYQKHSFDYLILDEAQVMKNTQTKIAHYLRQFDVGHCFALSGTPIENKLLEIWSIFQIVLPGLLPDKKTFLKMDAKEVARFIKPFIMRRRKEEVLPELPDLIEINYPNELDDKQKAIYLAQLRQMQETLVGASDEDINRHKIEILSGITRLRQICDTPSLFMDYKGNSGKLDSLRILLAQIKDNGHRALVFSQFRGMLDLVEDEMAELGLTSYKITGSTPADARQEMTRAFNNGSKDAVLISLKAGGVGLNLTGADTVILVDLWWNPAVEMQAISRAHRLGQKDNVEVYRLITRGTIEEKILEMQENKKNLVTTVLDGNEARASMTIEDIKEILGINQL